MRCVRCTGLFCASAPSLATSPRSRARAALAEVLGEIRPWRDGDEVWAEVETRAAALIVKSTGCTFVARCATPGISDLMLIAVYTLLLFAFCFATQPSARGA